MKQETKKSWDRLLGLTFDKWIWNPWSRYYLFFFFPKDFLANLGKQSFPKLTFIEQRENAIKELLHKKAKGPHNCMWEFYPISKDLHKLFETTEKGKHENSFYTAGEHCHPNLRKTACACIRVGTHTCHSNSLPIFVFRL